MEGVEAWRVKKSYFYMDVIFGIPWGKYIFVLRNTCTRQNGKEIEPDKVCPLVNPDGKRRLLPPRPNYQMFELENRHSSSLGLQDTRKHTHKIGKLFMMWGLPYMTSAEKGGGGQEMQQICGQTVV